MVLFLHNRYRTTGGEERTVEDLVWLVNAHLDEPARLLTRDSSAVGRGRAAVGLLRGGLEGQDVARAVRLSGARIVHAHNLHPSFGWRALAAAREAGARVVLHLHQYRMVCATGVCFTRGAECTRCHGRDTLPGVRLNCRGSLPEAIAYGASLALWQRRLAEQASAVIVPSTFARERLQELAAPLPWDRVHVLPPPVRTLPDRAAGESGSYALVVSRLAPEKGVDVAIEACRLAGLPLVVAGDGPELPALQELAGEADVRFAGRVDDAELARLRDGCVDCARPLALGRDVWHGRRRGDGRGPAGGRQPCGGAARAPRRGGARAAGRRGRAGPGNHPSGWRPGRGRVGTGASACPVRTGEGGAGAGLDL